MSGGSANSFLFEETLYTELQHKGYGQRFEVTNVVCQCKTDFQDLVIFDNPCFGRVLALDGIIQTTQSDEFIYHEMMAHVPILAHADPKNVLIIGAGDGGVLREVLRHPDITATMVEIDGTVVELCKTHMPSLSDGAFDNPRGTLIVGDGLQFVAQTDEMFDVIIVDSTDPMGPGEVLFTEEFYTDCKRHLNAGGILIAQNGVPFHQLDEVKTTASRIGAVFSDQSFYTVAVPTYIGGIMTLTWAADDLAIRQQTQAEITQRFDKSGIKTRYYNPAIHVAAFALPNYVLDATS